MEHSILCCDILALCKDWQDDSLGKGVCCRAWWPVQSQRPTWGGGLGLPLAGCLLTTACTLWHVCIPKQTNTCKKLQWLKWYDWSALNIQSYCLNNTMIFLIFYSSTFVSCHHYLNENFKSVSFLWNMVVRLVFFSVLYDQLLYSFWCLTC